MGILFRNSQGIETPVAGLAPAGQLVPSVSLYQSGTVSGASALVTTLEPGTFTILTVPLPTSMPDSNYVVQAGTDSAYVLAEESPSVRGTTSFRLYLTNQSLTETVDVSEVTITWQAFKLMTSEVTALDEAKIEQNTKNFAPNFSATSSYAVGEYCTYQGVLYRCTVQHTASAWNSSHFTATNVGDSIGRYNDEIEVPGYLSNDILIAIKESADAVENYHLFQGNTQAGAEAAWFGLKKTSTYWHCTVWDGHGLVSHLVYKNGTYTCNALHEGVSNF